MCCHAEGCAPSLRGTGMGIINHCTRPSCGFLLPPPPPPTPPPPPPPPLLPEDVTHAGTQGRPHPMATATQWPPRLGATLALDPAIPAPTFQPTGSSSMTCGMKPWLTGSLASRRRSPSKISRPQSLPMIQDPRPAITIAFTPGPRRPYRPTRYPFTPKPPAPKAFLELWATRINPLHRSWLARCPVATASRCFSGEHRCKEGRVRHFVRRGALLIC